MTALLVITLLGIIVLGYAVMNRVDNFIEEEGFNDDQVGRRKMGVLIFGSHYVVSSAIKAGIQCTELAETELPQDNCCYSAILILSESESDNLALCQAAHQKDPDICIIVRCADPSLKDAYKKLGACYLISPDMSIETILTELWRILK